MNCFLILPDKRYNKLIILSRYNISVYLEISLNEFKMSDFRKLNVEEMMKLLKSFTKKNNENIKRNNKLITEFSQSSTLKEGVKNTIRRLYAINKDLIEENKSFIKLYNDLVEFNSYLIAQVGSNKDKPNILTELLKLTQEQDDLDIGTKSLEELEELLQVYIAEEKYEECRMVQLLIDNYSK